MKKNMQFGIKKKVPKAITVSLVIQKTSLEIAITILYSKNG